MRNRSESNPDEEETQGDAGPGPSRWVGYFDAASLYPSSGEQASKQASKRLLSPKDYSNLLCDNVPLQPPPGAREFFRTTPPLRGGVADWCKRTSIDLALFCFFYRTF